MPELNANIPAIECLVRGNFLRNQQDSHDLKFPCNIFGVASLSDRVPMFHFLMEDGAIWWRMPINAFCWKEDAPELDIHDQVLWNSFSPYVTVTVFHSLRGMRMEYLDRHRKKHQGEYMMTFDWHSPEPNIVNPGWSENPGQHKCGHLIKLDDGNFAIQPNNRVILKDPSFTTKLGKPVIQRIINEHMFAVEDADRWVTEDSENYFYSVSSSQNDHHEKKD
jgi:hypothetical protein